MSEEILRILLEDLEIVRIVCKREDCGRVYEMPISKLTEGKHDFKCVCDAELRQFDKGRNMMADGFADLARAIAEIKKSQTARCEFILPVKHDRSTQS